ncbi:MAG: LysR family transcriptional regulator [Alphaproteobacteria bacterium]|nr:LysR family transcriptional regulator [Alphaproteobacteria bacterium]
MLQKTPSGYVLTPVGEAVLGNAERIENEALAVERTITGKDVRLEGTIRVTAVETLAVEVLMPIFAGFREAYPGIELELLADTRSLSLTKREADVAIRMARLPQSDLAVRKIGELASAVYASQAYLDQFGLPDFTSGAPGHHVILVLDDLMGVPEMAWFRGLTERAAIAFRSNSRYAHRAAAEAGIGLACLARYLGDGPALVPVDAPAVPRREIWLAVHNDVRHTPRIRALTEFLTEGLRRKAGTLTPIGDISAEAAS